MKKTVPVKKVVLKAPRVSLAYSRLHTLLHTVRCIAQYEDALCELSHEVKRAGVLSEESRVALDGILQKLPAQEYVHDLDAVMGLLEGARVLPNAGSKGKAGAAPAKRRAATQAGKKR